MTATLHAQTAAYPDVTAQFRNLASDYFEQVYFKFSPTAGHTGWAAPIRCAA